MFRNKSGTFCFPQTNWPIFESRARRLFPPFLFLKKTRRLCKDYTSSRNSFQHRPSSLLLAPPWLRWMLRLSTLRGNRSIFFQNKLFVRYRLLFERLNCSSSHRKLSGASEKRWEIRWGLALRFSAFWLHRLIHLFLYIYCLPCWRPKKSDSSLFERCVEWNASQPKACSWTLSSRKSAYVRSRLYQRGINWTGLQLREYRRQWEF